MIPHIILFIIFSAVMLQMKVRSDSAILPVQRAIKIVENTTEIENKIKSAIQMSCDNNITPTDFSHINTYLPVGFEAKNALGNSYINNIVYNSAKSTFTITSDLSDYDEDRLALFYERNQDAKYKLGIASCSGTLCSREIMLERVCP